MISRIHSSVLQGIGAVSCEVGADAVASAEGKKDSPAFDLRLCNRVVSQADIRPRTR